MISAFFFAFSSLLSFAQAAEKSNTLSAFSQIQVCAPLAVHVIPGAYEYAASGDQALLDALNFQVTDGTLFVTSTGGYSSSNPVEITISLPAEALRSVTKLYSGDLKVGPGFAPSNDININFVGYSATISIPDVKTTALKLRLIGDVTLAASGELTYVELTHYGTGDVYLAGTSGAVQLDVVGDQTVWISGSGSTTPKGGFYGGNLLIAQGNCQLDSSGTAPDLTAIANDPSLSPAARDALLAAIGRAAVGCTRQGDLELPEVTTRWSCGVSTQDPIGCPATAQPPAPTPPSSTPPTSTTRGRAVAGGSATVSPGGRTFSQSCVNGVCTTQSRVGAGTSSTFISDPGSGRRRLLQVQCAVDASTLSF